MTSDTHCTMCGMVMEERYVEQPAYMHIVRVERFNPDGTRRMELVCPNLQCERGCADHGGHQSHWWRSRCQRCGAALI